MFKCKAPAAKPVKFIELTPWGINTSAKMYINPEHITVFEKSTVDKEKTIVYIGTNVPEEVWETPDQILELINVLYKGV